MLLKSKEELFDALRGEGWRIPLRRFCEAVEKGEIPDIETLQTLSPKLRLILSGTLPKRALGMTKKRGRKQTRHTKTIEIGRAVWQLRQRKVPYRTALKQVREATGLSTKRISAYYTDYKRGQRRNSAARKQTARFNKQLNSLVELSKPAIHKQLESFRQQTKQIQAQFSLVKKIFFSGE